MTTPSTAINELPVPPAYRLQSPAGVAWATAIGTPVAGGIVLALNYWKWGQKGRAVAAIIAGLLATGFVCWLAWVLPKVCPPQRFLSRRLSADIT